jgi:hypothetical protein
MRTPSRVDAKSVATVVAAWTATGLFWSQQEALLLGLRHAAWAWPPVLLRNLLTAWLWVPLTPLVAWLTRRWSGPEFRATRWLRHAAAAPGIAAFAVLVQWSVGIRSFGGQWLDATSAYLFIWGITGYVVIAGLTRIRALSRRLRAGALRQTRLEERLARARTELVIWRLQPRVSLQALERIAEMATRDAERADDTTVRLGDFLRRLLQEAGHQTVALGREVAVVDGYLALRASLGGRQPPVRIDVPDALRDCAWPALTLQVVVHRLLEREGVGSRGLVALEVKALKRPAGLELRLRGEWGASAPAELAQDVASLGRELATAAGEMLRISISSVGSLAEIVLGPWGSAAEQRVAAALG